LAKTLKGQTKDLGFTVTKVLVPTDQSRNALFEFELRTIFDRRTVFLSMGQIDSLPTLEKVLRAAGYSASAAGTTYKEVQITLNALVPVGLEQAERWKITGVSGWNDYLSCFLLGDRPISEARLMLDPNKDVRCIPLGKAGSGPAWRETASHLGHSSAAVMLVCAALGSAALPFRRETSAAGYGFVISGATSEAITFVTRCVQSLIGHPDCLLPLRATEAGSLVETAKDYRNIPLVLDVLESKHGGHRGAMQRIANLLESGGSAILETIVITATEAGALGDRSAGGQVRFIEIPCGLMGPCGVIDRFKEAGVTDHASAQQWIEDRLAGLRQNHGHALEKFVNYLVELRYSKVTRLLNRHMTKFIELADAELGPTTAAALRVRTTFAFVYATGRLAIDAEVLPWEEHIQNSIMRCLDWHENRFSTPVAPSLDVTAAKEELLAALRNGAIHSVSPSLAALRDFGVVLDPSFKELRATNAFLVKVIPHKNILNAVLRSWEAQELVCRGDGQRGSWLHQVRYSDGPPVRVVRFSLRILQAEQAGVLAEGLDST
jgi:hypothetical protein